MSTVQIVLVGALVVAGILAGYAACKFDTARNSKTNASRSTDA